MSIPERDDLKSDLSGILVRSNFEMASLRSCLIVVSLILSEHLAAAEGVIVRFSQASGESSRARCGVLLEETEEALQFLDLKTFAEESIPKSSVRTNKNPITAI